MAKKFYAVARGRRPGIYTEWGGSSGAEAQVKGFTGAVFKSFPSASAAQAWYASKGGPPLAATDIPASPAVEPHTAELAAGTTVIYTDGACTGNPGPGGYGVVMLEGDQRRELAGGFARTTNNRMELLAVIEGLRALKSPRSVAVYTDSSYVANGLERGWAERWRQAHWQRREGSQWLPVANADLWTALLEQAARHQLVLHQVRGHQGVPENERCDALAVAAAARPNLPADPGFARQPQLQNGLFDPDSLA